MSGLYLDDQTSGWVVRNNSFVNMSMGVLLGGGKQNSFVDNYFQDVDLAVHFDNRGMGWEKAGWNCTSNSRGPGPCLPGGCIARNIVPDIVRGWPPVIGRDCAPRYPEAIKNASMTCFCNPEAVRTMLQGVGGEEWKRQFGKELAAIFGPACTAKGRGAIPCYNSIVNSTFCNVGKMIDASISDTRSWSSVVSGNVETTKCRL
eukprot:SAG31_NODE_2393_length_5793_cov_18.326484_5_plen_203_part_00